MTGYRRGVEAAIAVASIAVAFAITDAIFVLFGWWSWMAHPELPAILLTLFLWALIFGSWLGHCEHKRVNSWDGRRWTYPMRCRRDEKA